jgi:hypothetical protein
MDEGPMAFIEIPINRLTVNAANDRHGELENETAAIAELFRTREQHMRNLAADICQQGKIFDPPLVYAENDRYIVFDGNRRVTCLKLILRPERAPSQALQAYFRDLHNRWVGDFPESLTCQVENDRELIDSILFRRHTGSQSGVGQSGWDNRAKHNFVERTGRGGRIDVAVEIERLLEAEGQLPENPIPRSTLNRLLSSEAYRNRVGVSTEGNRFRVTHNLGRVTQGLARIATDLSTRQLVLGDLWDNEGKTAYLNRLDVEGVLPNEHDVLDLPAARPARTRQGVRGRPPVRRIAGTFIPQDAPAIPWRANQARIRAIWDELQSLSLANHPNAISALVRILLELSTESFLLSVEQRLGQGLAANFRTAIMFMNRNALIEQEYFDELDRMRQHTELISIQSMQRYVHSQDFAPLPGELEAYWTRLNRFLHICLTH